MFHTRITRIEIIHIVAIGRVALKMHFNTRNRQGHKLSFHSLFISTFLLNIFLLGRRSHAIDLIVKQMNNRKNHTQNENYK